MPDNFQFKWDIKKSPEDTNVWENPEYVLEQLNKYSLPYVLSKVSPSLLSNKDFMASWIKDEDHTFKNFIEGLPFALWDKDIAKTLNFLTSENYLTVLEAEASTAVKFSYVECILFSLLKARDNKAVDNYHALVEADATQQQEEFHLKENLTDYRLNFIAQEVADFSRNLTNNLSLIEIDEKINNIRTYLISKNPDNYLENFGFSLFHLEDFSALNEKDRQTCFYHSLEETSFSYKDIERLYGFEFINNKDQLLDYLSLTLSYERELTTSQEISQFQAKYKALLQDLTLLDIEGICTLEAEQHNNNQLSTLQNLLPQLFSAQNPQWTLAIEKNPELLNKTTVKELIKKDRGWLVNFIDKNIEAYPDLTHILPNIFIFKHISNPSTIDAMADKLSLEVLEDKRCPENFFSKKTILHYIKNTQVITADCPKPISNYLEQVDNCVEALHVNAYIYKYLSPEIKANSQVYYSFLFSLSSNLGRYSIAQDQFIIEPITTDFLKTQDNCVKILDLKNDNIKLKFFNLIPNNIWDEPKFILRLAADIDKNDYMLRADIPERIKAYYAANQTAIKKLGSFEQFIEIEIQQQMLSQAITPQEDKLHKTKLLKI